MSVHQKPTYKLKERLYDNNEKTIIIFKARKKKTIRYIAVKAYYKIKHSSYNKEYLILKNINCPSIIKVIGAAEDKNNFYMEMEYCSSGDLSHCLWPNRGCNYLEKVIKAVSTQILIGLKILHDNGIIHCNLKPSNILIDEFGNARICDFKKALKIDEMTNEDIRKNKSAMTPCYTAPEILNTEGNYSFKTDLWALGCIMYEMAVGQVPFFDTVVNKLILKIINDDINFNKKQFNKYSEEFMDVLQKLLEKDPNQRPSWGEIENFAFWNVNEKGFYDAFPNLNFNNNNNYIDINNFISNNFSNISIFSKKNNNSNNSIKINNLNYNHSNSVCNIININNKLNSNSWNSKNNEKLNKNYSLSSYPKSVMNQRINTDYSDFNVNINKTKSIGFHSQLKIKQNSPSPLSKKNKIKSFEIKKLEITEEDIGYNNIQNNNDITDENDREFNFNLGENYHNVPYEEDYYGPNKFKNLQINQNKNILSLSGLNVSKLMDKNKTKKINESNDMSLSLANPDELPQIQYLMIHNTDKNIKPIIGNRIIEQKKYPIIYDENKIPIKPIYKMDKLKELIKGDNFTEFEKFLKQLLFCLNDYKKKKKNENFLNLLNYFETIILSKDISNNIINTPLLKFFIDCLNIKDDKIQIRSCSIIANLIRFSTNLNISLDNYNLTEILISFISDTNVSLNRKAMATLGEYLFFVSTQIEVELEYVKKGAKPKWKIMPQAIKALLFALNHIDEKVRFYSLKTIENICTLTSISKNYFANNDDFISKIIDIFNSPCQNQEIRTSAINTVSHIIRLNPSLMKIFLDKMDDISIIIENENQKNQQYIINCLLFGLEKDKKNIKFISKNKLIPTLINLIDNSNNIIKGKIILLISLIFNEINTIIKYGKIIFNILGQLRKEKKLFYYHVKIFESFLKKYCELLIKHFKNYAEEFQKSNINENQNISKIISLLKCFNIISSYHKVSYILYNYQFLNILLNLLMNSNLNSEQAELIFEFLKSFSENSMSVEENCDFILTILFKKILLLTKKLNNEYRRFPLNICANIISALLEDEKLYSSTSIEEGKTNQINNLIIDILPEIYDLLTNKDTVYESLAFLSLIIERNIAFIRFYKSIGIIDYIFVLMKEDNIYSNLNLIKILIKFIESNETTFKDIVDLNLIDKVNYLIKKDNPEEITIYTEYVIEMFFDLMFKINEIKRKFSSSHSKEEVDKKFIKKIEGVAANFSLSIRLLSCDNFNLQEKSCINLIFILQFFPNMYIKSVNTNVIFEENDIPYLLKGLDSGNKKIYKKMIKIFKWIIECQKNAKNVLKNYTSYIQICIEKIINISDEPDVLEIAKNFLIKDFPKLFVN